jgi:hypothetical protein
MQNDDRPDWRNAVRANVTAEEQGEDEGARPSSLIPVHRLSKPDPLHELNLLRMMQIADERTVRELGALPSGGLPGAIKRRPMAPSLATPSVMLNNEEDEAMKLKKWVAVTFAAAGALTWDTATPANNSAHSEPSIDAPSFSTGKGYATVTTKSASPSPSKELHRNVPQGFSSYAVETISNNNQCVVGAVVDDDGTNQKPFVYVVDPRTKQVAWSEELDLPANTYQSRATHCLESDGSLFVLLQSDTQSEQTLSQTLLRVEKLNVNDGSLKGSEDISLPSVNGAYSAWVDDEKASFHIEKNLIAVSGHYYKLADANKRLTFRAVIKDSLPN